MSRAATPAFLFDGPETAERTLVLAHGAGAFMDSDFMTAIAAGLARHGGWRIARFEFPYMAARRADGRRRPPNPQATLLATWGAVVDALGPGERLAVGGKSLGGRMASLLADRHGVRGLVCLGYPFHPAGRPEKLRVAHLGDLQTPTLIVQGTRDPLGNAEEVAGYPLSPAIRVHWIGDGDHSLVPPKSSGRTAAEAWAETVAAVAAFLDRL